MNSVRQEDMPLVSRPLVLNVFLARSNHSLALAIVRNVLRATTKPRKAKITAMIYVLQESIPVLVHLNVRGVCQGIIKPCRASPHVSGAK